VIVLIEMLPPHERRCPAGGADSVRSRSPVTFRGPESIVRVCCFNAHLGCYPLVNNSIPVSSPDS
jgi:hypothetical protein